MIQPAVADVVGPAVAAHDPHTLAHQRIRQRSQVARLGPRSGRALQFLLEQLHAPALAQDAFFVRLICVQQRIYQVSAERIRQLRKQLARVFALLVERQAKAQAVLGIVLKERTGPRRAATLLVKSPRRRRQVAAVNRRAASGVGDNGAVAEQLRDELDVGRLAAAGARAGKLEQRAEQLRVFDLADAELGAIHVRQREEEIPVFDLLLADGRLRRHVDRPQPRLGLVLGRADLDAQRTAGAIFRRDLQRVGQAGKFLPLGRRVLERRRRILEPRRVIDFGADDRVRANQHALAALDARLFVPGGNLERNVALFPLRRAGGESAVYRNLADGHVVAQPGDHGRRDLLDERGRLGRHGRPDVERARHLVRHLDLVQILQRLVYRRKVLFHHRFAALAVGLFDGMLDLGDGFVARQHSADGKKARLHDRVDAPAHAGLLGDLVSVNHVESEFLVNDLFLHRARQVIPHLVRPVGAVEQKDRARLGRLKQVEPLQERELVARDEIRRADQVRRVNRLGAKAQVRSRHRARFSRVVHEIALRVIFGAFADNLDRVLVRAHRAIRAHAVKHRAHRLGVFGRKVGIVIQAGVRHVVHDADGKVILGALLLHLVEHAPDHGRRKFLRGEAIASADDARHGRREARRYGLGKGRHHVQVERLARAARFLGAVEYGNRLDGGRERFDKALHREGAIQAYLEHAQLFAARVQILDSLLRDLAARAHNDDHTVGVRRADVVEQVILPPDDLGKLVHRFLDNARRGEIERIHCLARLKVHVGVLRGAANAGTIRRERASAMRLHQAVVNHRADVVLAQLLDFHHFV